jgi:rare lipoprotein A
MLKIQNAMDGFKAGRVFIAALTVIGLFWSCTPAPRYTRDYASAPQKRTAEPATPSPGVFQEGMASYYADEFHGRKTANGDIFDKNALTAAHLSLPFGTKIKVTNLENNITVIVTINDRGPYAKGRILDLSLAGARALDMLATGTARIQLEILP